jgi:hypothetical protein
MQRFRRSAAGTGMLAALAAFLLASGSPPPALAHGRAEPHLRYQPTWAAAVAESRSRNAVIFATFHKDN